MPKLRPNTPRLDRLLPPVRVSQRMYEAQERYAQEAGISLTAWLRSLLPAHMRADERAKNPPH